MKIISNEDFGKIRLVEIDNKPYFVANDIAKSLCYKNASKAIKDHCKHVIKYYIEHPQSKNKKLEVNVINNEDVLRLVEYSQLLTELQKENYINFLNLNNYIVLKSRKEIEFVNDLESFLKAIGINDGISQYSILNYKIDYYIPSLKIAVEYDENNHKDYSYEAQEFRQQKIEEILKCKFIRLSDKNSNSFNIGLFLKGLVA